MCTGTPWSSEPATCPTCHNAYGVYRYKCCNVRSVVGNIVTFYISGSSTLFNVNFGTLADVCPYNSMPPVAGRTGWLVLSETWLRNNNAPWSTGDPKHPASLMAAPVYIKLKGKVSAPRALFTVADVAGFGTLSTPLSGIFKWDSPMAFGAVMHLSSLYRIDDGDIEGLPPEGPLRDALMQHQNLVCLGTTYNIEFHNPAVPAEKHDHKDFHLDNQTLVKSPVKTLLPSSSTHAFDVIENWWRDVTGT